MKGLRALLILGIVIIMDTPQLLQIRPRIHPAQPIYAEAPVRAPIDDAWAGQTATIEEGFDREDLQFTVPQLQGSFFITAASTETQARNFGALEYAAQTYQAERSRAHFRDFAATHLQGQDHSLLWIDEADDEDTEGGLEEEISELREDLTLRVEEVSYDVADLSERVQKLESRVESQESSIRNLTAEMERLGRYIRDMLPIYEEWAEDQRRRRASDHRRYMERYPDEMMFRTELLTPRFVSEAVSVGSPSVFRVDGI